MDRDDDDPTRALDDFVHRLKVPPPPDDPGPDLSDLMHRIGPQAGAVGARPRGGRLRSGERWSADDVVDVPSVELPPVHTPAPPDGDALAAAVADAARAAAGAADAAMAAVPWQPDIDALLQRRAVDPRLLAAWQPGCWTGAVREVLAAATEVVSGADGPLVETYAPHRLLLAWPPQTTAQPLLGRWPAQVRLSAVPREAAAEVLLAQLPDDALLWLAADAGDADWALAAEIVLHHDPALRPFQIQGLRAFIEAEREARFTRLNDDYEQRAAGAAVTRKPGPLPA